MIWVDIEGLQPEGPEVDPNSETAMPIQIAIAVNDLPVSSWVIKPEGVDLGIVLGEWHKENGWTKERLEGPETWPLSAVVDEVAAILVEHPDVPLVAYNGWSYDFPILQRILGKRIGDRKLLDLLPVVRYFRPGLRNSLGYLGRDLCISGSRDLHDAKKDIDYMRRVWAQFIKLDAVQSDPIMTLPPNFLAVWSKSVYDSWEAMYAHQRPLGCNLVHRNREGVMSIFYGKKYPYGTPLLEVDKDYVEWALDTFGDLTDGDKEIMTTWVQPSGGYDVLTKTAKVGQELFDQWERFYTSTPPKPIQHPELANG